MRKIFDEKKLQMLAEQHRESYINAFPFPNIYFDNFMDAAILDDAVKAFPSPDQFSFYKYDNALEKKLAYDKVNELPEVILDILLAMNSAPFISFLETLTGIDGLIADPWYRGGGIHQILPGGKLDVHIDFNKHQKLRLDRRLNALLYLNKDWDESYGGFFELWTGERTQGGHVLHKCEKKILPLFNRLAIFSTSEISYHGHPEPLTCPPDRARQSIATYYYSNGRPEDKFGDVDAHSTTFIKRPEDPDDPELAELREKRNRGRLSTNIK